jgi:2-polyprenyl-6-methoxyphenol hydroxylase-like FAD-dependent oxidoreductase
MGKTVAIAGAGIAGFAAAATLQEFGHSVRIYEESTDPREFGAGIYLKENSLQVLDKLGLTERLAAGGVRLKAARIIDEDGVQVTSRDMSEERLIVVLRADLHNALREAALERGAELVTGTKVLGASPDGTLSLSDGRDVTADLVLGADGVNSRVRDSLGLMRARITLGDGATRVTVAREGDEPYSTEHWAGKLRVGIAPCSPDRTYMFIIGPEKDRRACRLPLDKAYWSRAFPHLAGHFARIEPGSAVHHTHVFVHCESWVRGKVAIIGDAAHAQPPNFGQGAGLAIAAVWEMAETLQYGSDVRTGLEDWQASTRPRIDMVQRLTTAYDLAAYKWPRPLAPLKSKLFTALATTPGISKKWEYYWRGGVERPVRPAVES